MTITMKVLEWTTSVNVGTNLLSFIFNEEFWISLASIVDNKLAKNQSRTVVFMCADN